MHGRRVTLFTAIQFVVCRVAIYHVTYRYQNIGQLPQPVRIQNNKYLCSVQLPTFNFRIVLHVVKMVIMGDERMKMICCKF